MNTQNKENGELKLSDNPGPNSQITEVNIILYE